MPQLSIWLVATVALTALMGALTRAVRDFVRGDSSLAGVLGSPTGVNVFVASVFSVVQLVAVLLTVTVMLGARVEEGSGRLELLIAAPVSRMTWLASRAALAVSAGLVLAVLSALAMWGAARAAGTDLGFGRLLEIGLDCLPLLVLAVGFATAGVALVPRAAVLTYAVVAVAYLWDALGTVLKASTWLLDVSPFHAIARLPVDRFAVLPAGVLVALGLGLGIAGAQRCRTRDLVSA